MSLHLVGITVESDKHGPFALLATPFSSSTYDGIWFCRYPNRLMRVRESIEDVEKRTGKFTLIIRISPTMNCHFPLSKSTTPFLEKLPDNGHDIDDISLCNILKAPAFQSLHLLLKSCPKLIDKRVSALIRSVICTAK